MLTKEESNKLEKEIKEVFEDAVDVKDTIYFDAYTTLYEEIVNRISWYIEDE